MLIANNYFLKAAFAASAGLVARNFIMFYKTGPFCICRTQLGLCQRISATAKLVLPGCCKQAERCPPWFCENTANGACTGPGKIPKSALFQLFSSWLLVKYIWIVFLGYIRSFSLLCCQGKCRAVATCHLAHHFKHMPWIHCIEPALWQVRAVAPRPA